MWEKLEDLLASADKADKINPAEINPSVWAEKKWDFLNGKVRSQVLSKILLSVIEQAKKEDLYKKAYKDINNNIIKNMDNIEEMLLELPVLFKDNTSFGATGFRSLIQQNPHIMKHGDQNTATEIFKSGGTLGLPTPTFITEKDLELESLALGHRTFLPGGFEKGDKLYTTYNPAHKGGREIQLAALKIGMEVTSKRPEDDLKNALKIIKSYKINAIATVQPAISEDDNTQKGAGITFLNLFKEEHDLFGKHGQIKKAFITGFKIPESVIALAESIDLDLFTTYGCSEFIPLANSTNEKKIGKKCNFNDQHLLYGPHVVMVVKQEDNQLVPVKKGEKGIVIVTTLGINPGRTIYLNYAIGDTAVLKEEKCECGRTTPIIGDIGRTDNPTEILGGGCRCV